MQRRESSTRSQRAWWTISLMLLWQSQTALGWGMNSTIREQPFIGIEARARMKPMPCFVTS